MNAISTGHRHHVVIVGCGFGGLAAAKALRRADVDITVIDRTNHHLNQPLLHQLATGILSERDIARPIRDILRRQRNTRVVVGEVVDVDFDGQQVTVETLGQRSHIEYDTLIVAAGASPSYFGHPEFVDYAPPMKTIDQALELRRRILGAFEMAERETDAAARRRWRTFVVVGAGPTGVELAGQLAELLHRTRRGNFRDIDRAEARVVLLGAAPTILPTFPEALRARAAGDLRELGVEVHSGTKVTGVDQEGIDTDASAPSVRRIETATKIWAAGVQASRLGGILAGHAGVELDRAGRVNVDPDCTLRAHPEVFVIGDLMSLDSLPGVTQVAIQSGQHAALTITRRLAGDTTPQPFRYHEMGSIATTSRLRAIAVVGRLHLSGFPAWALWLVVRLMSLTGFKNRLSVLFKWTAAFFEGRRGQRIVTAQQVFARRALDVQARERTRATLSTTARADSARP